MAQLKRYLDPLSPPSTKKKTLSNLDHSDKLSGSAHAVGTSLHLIYLESKSYRYYLHSKLFHRHSKSQIQLFIQVYRCTSSYKHTHERIHDIKK